MRNSLIKNFGNIWNKMLCHRKAYTISNSDIAVIKVWISPTFLSKSKGRYWTCWVQMYGSLPLQEPNTGPSERADSWLAEKVWRNVMVGKKQSTFSVGKGKVATAVRYTFHELMKSSVFLSFNKYCSIMLKESPYVSQALLYIMPKNQSTGVHSDLVDSFVFFYKEVLS